MVTTSIPPELEGCQSQGDLLEDAIANTKEAIELYLETLSEDEIDPNILLEPVSGCPGKPSRDEKARSFAERQKFRSRTRANVAAGAK